MIHLIICREYPPAPGGGIGTYVDHISRLLAEAGETVHVIGQAWRGCPAHHVSCSGRLIIHRIQVHGQRAHREHKKHPLVKAAVNRPLFGSSTGSDSFAWNAALLAEALVEAENIQIIEAQEYDAPLYYFQLRRALGLGPLNKPPCLLHLHSPTWLIARHNDWDLHQSWLRKIMAREHFSISAADALVSPSRHLALQVGEHFGLDYRNTAIIPYPLGYPARYERSMDTWRSGSICYVGRLEPRKGFLEWLDAAIRIVEKHPDLRFDFIGANVIGANRIQSELIIRRRIPSAMTGNFHFHGHLPRHAIPAILSRARMLAVPSRWDNFPYACMEAMSHGLPVLATRQGGMAEMIMDGASGWLVDRCDRDSLTSVLTRALGTPPESLMAMGKEAARTLSVLCDNATIVDRQLTLRRQLARQRPVRNNFSAEAMTLTTKKEFHAWGHRSHWSSVRSFMSQAALAVRYPGIAMKIIREKVAQRP